MTVSYQYDVASSTSGGFTRLLLKWRGSLYKLIHKEFGLFCFAYGIMSLVYRLAFTVNQKRSFEQISFYCDTYMNYIPLSFILGFYVTFVASRWWQQYMAIPWPDKILHATALYVTGTDEKGRILRRSMARYLNLTLVLVLRSISSAVKKRFPTFDHVVEAGFMTSPELQIFHTVSSKEFNTYWIPCTWFTTLIKEASRQNRLTDPIGMKLIMEEFCEFRQKCGLLWSYDWISIPLVYTQVVTIATYSFFIAAIVGRQFVEKSPIPFRKADIYVPFFTILQFFFYMGLLKVAEQLINPFGDDDEDFELNWIIDRHLKVSYLIVDTLLLRNPPLTKDIYFDEESPQLPYTEASAVFKKKTYRGSVANMVVPEEKQHLILPDIIEEGEESEEVSHSHLLIKNRRTSLLSSLSHATSDSTHSCRNLTVPESSHSARDSSLTTLQTPTSTKEHKITETSKLFPQSKTSSRSGLVGTSRFVPSEFPQGSSLNELVGEGNMDCVYLPFKDVCLNIEDQPQSREKSKSWIPASLRGKLALKSKPVVKWRPYKRPDMKWLEQSESLAVDNAAKEELASGIFEDECAFMWRTIEDEDASLKTTASSLDCPESSCCNAQLNEYGKEMMAHYNAVKPCFHSQKTSSMSIIDDICDRKLTRLKDHHCLERRVPRKNLMYKPKCKLRSANTTFRSLPYITGCHCGQDAILPNLIRSLSESSVFLDAVILRINQLKSNLETRNLRHNLKSVEQIALFSNRYARHFPGRALIGKASNFPHDLAFSVQCSHKSPFSVQCSHKSPFKKSSRLKVRSFHEHRIPINKRLYKRRASDTQVNNLSRNTN